MTRRKSIQAAALTLMTLSASAAGAATHVFINPDIFNSTTADRAFVDVSGEPAVADVTVTVFPTGAPPASSTVPMNNKNYAVSPELFALSRRRTALVFAVTTDPGVPSVAVLRQQNGSFREALTIPSSNKMLGLSFNLPVGDLTGGGNLYIGNPNGADASVVLQYGGSTSPLAASATVSAYGVVKVPIASSQTQSNLLVTVTNGVQVVVEAVIGTRILVVLPIGPAVG